MDEVTKKVAGHYHVDVFAGAKQSYVRGFTLLPDGSGSWVVHDEIGLLGAPRAISDPLSLPDAVRFAFARLYEVCEKPLRPVWGTAPYELLGYARPSLSRIFDFLRRRKTEVVAIGPDGLPSGPGTVPT